MYGAMWLVQVCTALDQVVNGLGADVLVVGVPLQAVLRKP